MEDADIPDPAATFTRRGGKARRYWGKVNRGVKNFRRRRERRRLQRHQAKGGDVVSGVSVLWYPTFLFERPRCS